MTLGAHVAAFGNITGIRLDKMRSPRSFTATQTSHLMNFGAFVTPEDNILFDVNDFDETLPGVDFTVDLKRLAASVAVAASASGTSKKQARVVAAATVKAYFRTCQAVAAGDLAQPDRPRTGDQADRQ
jgi:uncharacterized protein (DUF2252 family)